MSSFLSLVFGEVDFTTLTPVAILCVYCFAITLECISSIIQSTLKAGGVSN